jgi:hypothetical protein
MIYTKRIRFSNAEMERLAGISNEETCLKLDCHHDNIHDEWVIIALCVSSIEVVATLFPSLVQVSPS